MIFFFFDPQIFHETFFRQFVHLVEYAVYIRIDTIHNGKTRLFYQILAFVGSNMLFIDITLLFQLITLVTEGGNGLLIIHSPLHIGYQYMYQCLFIAAQPMIVNEICLSFFGNLQCNPVRSEQAVNTLLDKRYIHRNRSCNIPAENQRLLQPFGVNTIFYFRTFIENPE